MANLINRKFSQLVHWEWGYMPGADDKEDVLALG